MHPTLRLDQPQLWNKYITFLHGLVTELTNQYKVDAFWFDCYNTPPSTDTFFEVLLPLIRYAIDGHEGFRIHQGVFYFICFQQQQP